MPQRYPRRDGRPAHSYHFDNNRHGAPRERAGGLRCCLCSKPARRRPAVNRSTQKNGSTGQAPRISIGGTLKIRRFTAAAAMLAAGSLVLAACGDGGGTDPDAGDTDDAGIDDGDDSGISQEQALTVGWNQPFYEYNADSQTGNATANSIVLYMIQSQFKYYDAELELIQDESFGTFEKVNDDPLQVKYTFADTAEWSDGTPVDAADLVMAWGAGNARFNTVEEDEETGEVDEAEADE